MKNNSIGEWIGCGVAALCTVVQTNEKLQTISLVLTCLATATTLAFNIWKWFKKAMADGKITVDEIDDLDKTVNNGIDNIKESLNGKNK